MSAMDPRAVTALRLLVDSVPPGGSVVVTAAELSALVVAYDWHVMALRCAETRERKATERITRLETSLGGAIADKHRLGDTAAAERDQALRLLPTAVLQRLADQGGGLGWAAGQILDGAS